jgi:hypothetical protein
MQLKMITAMIVLLLVVASLLVAGCTTSSDNTATNQPTTNNMISSLNKYFNSMKNMTMVHSFEQTIVDHTHNAYIGSFKDGADKLTPKLHNYTVIVASNSNDGQMLFAQQVNKTKSAGYVEITQHWIHSGTDTTNQVHQMQTEQFTLPYANHITALLR